MKKTIAKLSIIIAIFAGLNMINIELISATTGYSYYIFIGVALALVVGLLINEKDIHSREAIAVYGASFTLLGAIVSAFFTYNFVSVLGKTVEDLQIFYKALIPSCILAIGFGIFGLVIVVFCLRKNALLLLIPYLVGIGINTMLMRNIYISCTQNIFTADVMEFHSSLQQICNVMIGSSIIYWVLVVYNKKRSNLKIRS